MKYKCGCTADGDNVANYCPMHGDAEDRMTVLLESVHAGGGAMYDEKAYKVKTQIGKKFCIYSRTGDAFEDIKTHIFECSTDEMTISVVKMTDAELSKVPEFDGW